MPRKVKVMLGRPDGPEREVTVEIHDLDVAPWGSRAELRHVGTDIPRLDAPQKTTGAARFSADMLLPNMAYSALVRSPHAHARVKRVSTTYADTAAGVLATRVLVDRGGVVKFAGKGIVAVCAETEEALSDGLAAVEIEYDVLPCAVTTDDGMARGAPKVDEGRENASAPRGRGVQKRGDPDGALDKAAHTVSATFRTQVQTHSALESHGCVVDPTGDGFTVYASTQGTGSFRGSIAKALGVPPGEVRVISEHVGGGFGAKLGGIDEWDRAAAQFAVKLKRPVHGLIDRRAEHLVAGNRPDSIQKLTMGADEGGKITVLTAETHGTAGNGAGGAGAANTRVYGVPNLRATQVTVSTFTGRGRAFRAPGHPQGFFALEGIVDMLAHERGEDPLAFRLRNDAHPLRQVQWRIGAERIDWIARRKVAPGESQGPVKRGVGCAAAIWYQRGRGRWVVELELSRDGSVTVKNAVQDIGTGTRTVLAIIVAEELGLAPSDVTVRIGDTAYPAGPGSGGSTTAPSIGPAAREAAARAHEALAALLAEAWETDAEKVNFANGVFTGPGAAAKKANFKEACGLIGPDGLTVRGQRRPNYDGFHGETAGCQFVDVAVDTETGVVRVERVVAVHDAGRIIDRLTARSQVVGGVIQGISYALHEDRRLDRNLGDMVNPTFDTYRILGVADCPRIDVVLTSLDSGFNNAGMMGLGEPVTVPTAGAIGNAVFHALGVRVNELPITPARVLAALGKG